VFIMAGTADLSPTIVETLYWEALVLADEARAAFDLSGRLTLASQDEDLARVALSCEALRTTTRMMHAIAWLLNHRAYFAGELSEFQLRRHGRLPQAPAESQSQPLAELPAELWELVERTRRFYARVERLDKAWQQRFATSPGAVHRLRDRLGKAVASL
jgi:regulator of CtrA degradation